MGLTITKLLYGGLVWNKEKVVISHNEKESEMKRLEFQYEAIDKDYKVTFIEPKYCKETDTAYLVLTCEENPD